MFSGGRGTQSLAKAFVAHPQINLYLLLNAYDDGLSTGKLRRFIPGFLGPSDFRKNISCLIPDTSEAGNALKRLLEYRFPANLESENAIQLLSELYSKNFESRNFVIDSKFWEDLQLVSYKQARYIESNILTFLDYWQKERKKGRIFEFHDCSFGNIIFSGVFLHSGYNFNQTIIDLENVLKPAGKVLNVTRGENYVLVGLKSDGSYLCNEAEIVSPQNALAIEEIYLLENYLNDSEEKKLKNFKNLELKKDYFKKIFKEPKISEEAKSILETADLIIYGPGTQHSSLFPSYLTKGVGEAISKNTEAEKVFIANTRVDYEIQGENIKTLCQKLHFYLNRKGRINLPPEELVTRYFFQDPDGMKNDENDHLDLDLESFLFPSRETLITDWESDPGKHLGKRVLDELIAIVNEKAKTFVKSFSYMVTIVIPVLNEERTLEKVLTKLNLINLQPYGLGKELIVVDGGSIDRSREIAQSKEYVRFFDLPKEMYGRGSALRYGTDQARGNIVVFFPSDNEYEPNNIIDLARALQTNEFEAVFGSRSFKCLNLNDRIRSIYKGQILPYLISKYGGYSLSILTLLLFNRFVTDPLTGIKAFDRRLLKKLELKSNGVELETEIIAKLCQAQKYILEIPVEYSPRLKSEGKKITIRDGINSFLNLLKLRFKR